MKKFALVLAGLLVLPACAPASPKVPDGEYMYRYGGTHRMGGSELTEWVEIRDNKIVGATCHGANEYSDVEGETKMCPSMDKYKIKSYDPDTQVLVVDGPSANKPLPYCSVEQNNASTGVGREITAKSLFRVVDEMTSEWIRGNLSGGAPYAVCTDGRIIGFLLQTDGPTIDQMKWNHHTNRGSYAPAPHIVWD